MNSNFEWQKYQANERGQSYRQEAKSHRIVKEGNGRQQGHQGTFLVILALLAGIFSVLLVTGCSPELEPTIIQEAIDTVEIDSDSQPSAWLMADRISFQDKRDAYLNEQAPIGNNGWTMAERINFQDKREAYLSGYKAAGWTMAERILFQDQVLGNSR